tara:strand:- start:139 stop:348 length:210 start_codon:yes stop_codon:yes gene_type:complete
LFHTLSSLISGLSWCGRFITRLRRGFLSRSLFGCGLVPLTLFLGNLFLRWRRHLFIQDQLHEAVWEVIE